MTTEAGDVDAPIVTCLECVERLGPCTDDDVRQQYRHVAFDANAHWVHPECVGAGVEKCIRRSVPRACEWDRQTAKWGLVLGSLSDEQAFEYLQEAERNIAVVREAVEARLASER